MELKEFIKSVLMDICDGVNEAKDATKKSVIAPYSIGNKIVDGGQLVSFDVSVTIADSIEGNGGGKIQVLSSGISGEAKMAKATSSVSRISFHVPIYFGSMMQ